MEFFDGVTYHVRRMYLADGTTRSFHLDLSLTSGFNAATVRIPDKLKDAVVLRFGTVSLRLSDAERRSVGIAWPNSGIHLSAGQQVQVKLTFFDQEKYEREMRKGASRSGVCGESTTNSLANDEEGDTPGLWHCHGDIYHYHADWRKAHTPHIATEDLRPTGDPPARPPATAPASEHLIPQKTGHQPVRAEGFGNWHSHPDGRFHRHAGGH